MMKVTGIAPIVLFAILQGGFVSGQQTGSRTPPPAPPPAPGARPRTAPQLLFRMDMENTDRLYVTDKILTSPDLTLQTYGDGKNILVAIGNAPTDPHLFDGLCDRPCGLTVADKNKDFDLRGRAKIKWNVIVSGFHHVQPLIKLADGTVLIGDQADGSGADWHSLEASFSEQRWLRLDPVRGVTMGVWVEKPDLSRVKEVGFFDVIPGSGTPVGGWIALSAFELWGQPVPHEATQH